MSFSISLNLLDYIGRKRKKSVDSNVMSHTNNVPLKPHHIFLPPQKILLDCLQLNSVEVRQGKDFLPAIHRHVIHLCEQMIQKTNFINCCVERNHQFPNQQNESSKIGIDRFESKRMILIIIICSNLSYLIFFSFKLCMLLFIIYQLSYYVMLSTWAKIIKLMLVGQWIES